MPAGPWRAAGSGSWSGCAPSGARRRRRPDVGRRHATYLDGAGPVHPRRGPDGRRAVGRAHAWRPPAASACAPRRRSSPAARTARGRSPSAGPSPRARRCRCRRRDLGCRGRGGLRRWTPMRPAPLRRAPRLARGCVGVLALLLLAAGVAARARGRPPCRDVQLTQDGPGAAAADGGGRRHPALRQRRHVRAPGGRRRRRLGLRQPADPARRPPTPCPSRSCRPGTYELPRRRPRHARRAPRRAGAGAPSSSARRPPPAQATARRHRGPAAASPSPAAGAARRRRVPRRAPRQQSGARPGRHRRHRRGRGPPPLAGSSFGGFDGLAPTPAARSRRRRSRPVSLPGVVAAVAPGAVARPAAPCSPRCPS